MSTDEKERDQHPLNKHHRAVLETIPKSWILRDCEAYKDEYNGCSSMKGKLYMYYINGKITQCDDWKQNYDDCKLWVNNTDESAAKRVIEREEKRIYERLKGHFENDVWESRASVERPPPEWNQPLPDHLAESAEDSYLKQCKESLESGNKGSTQLELRALMSKTTSSTEGCVIL
jgi:hypothetical protein